MDGIIFSRAVLLGVILLNAFVGYAAHACHRHINRHVLNVLFILELVAVTAFIVYDNIQSPPYCSWFWAIVGYVFVYFIMIGVWFAYAPNSVMDEGVAYRFIAYKRVEFLGKMYECGYAEVRGRLVDVLLPAEEYKSGTTHGQVMFKEVIYYYIIVTAV